MIETKRVQLPQCLILEKPFSWCPGCGYGIITRILAESIDELGIREKTIAVIGIGCFMLIDSFLNVDFFKSLHGRSPAAATGLKLASPDKVVFTFQGDGDCASIGMSEVVHAANRGTPITVLMVNNSMYGMTGGQMGATTLIGEKTTTSPQGRKASIDGIPVRLPEMLQAAEGAAYLARVSISSPEKVMQAKKSIIKALECQIEKRGFSYVEFLSPCTTGLRKNPPEAMAWVREELEKYFPIGVIKSKES